MSRDAGLPSRERPELTTAEAATLLGVSASRVRQHVLAGRLPAEKRGRDLFIPRAALEALAGKAMGEQQEHVPMCNPRHGGMVGGGR